MEDVNGFGKILFDKKVMKILEATRENSLTIKEIGKKIKESPTSLYYPVKKLIEIQALKITKEEKVKNLTEYYYSSKHLHLNGNVSYEGEMLEINKDQLIQAFLLEVNKAAQALNRDVELFTENDEYNNSTSELSIVTKRLSYENWKELNSKIRSLIEDYQTQIDESKKQEEQEEQEEYIYLIASYKPNE